MKFFRNYFCLLIMGVILSSCLKKEPTIPPDILSKKSMVEILVDVHIAEASLSTQYLNPDSVAKISVSYYDYIYKIHNTTAKDFKKSYNFYMLYPLTLDKIYEQVLNEISKKQAINN